MAETNIETVLQLSAYVAPLKALGYRNTDQLVGAGLAARLPLAKYLKLAPAALDHLLAGLPQRQSPIGAVHAPPVHRLGLRLDLMPRRVNFAMAMSMSVATQLPASTDLVSQMGPVRDQANRGTCVAHATTAIVEHYWNLHGKGLVNLSRQFAYWDCKQHDGHTEEEGTWISIAMPLLQSDGCPLEVVWSYNPSDIPNDESQGPPPAGAVASADEFKIPSFRQLSATAVHDLKAELADGRPVAFSIPVFNSWYFNNKEVVRSGEIINPLPDEISVGGHAMCMVGYMDEPAEIALGGGRFIIRNSWNSTWGTESTTGHVGYGTIPYSYISRFGLEAFTVV